MKIMNEDKTRYFYLRDVDNHPVALVGYRVKESPSVSQARYAVSICHPNDRSKFDRKEAHNLVNDRLALKAGSKYSFIVLHLGNTTPVSVLILKELRKHPRPRIAEAALCTYVRFTHKKRKVVLKHLGTASGRLSASEPNLLNTPKEEHHA